MNERTGTKQRKTKETEVSALLCLDGTGVARVATGIGFLDHLLFTLVCHGWFDLELTCTGDLQVDDHHTVEDCALVLGQALDQALGNRQGIVRFGTGFAPHDEALARVVVDLSGRPAAKVNLGLTRERLGGLACENVEHLLRSLALGARCTLHVDLIRGQNDHHSAEAIFKALALALRMAVSTNTATAEQSTKGVL